MLARGVIYIVATPIGNLGDISLRAIETLKSVDVIAAEDMRVTRKILSHFDIQNRLVSYHEHNEIKQAEGLISLINQGKSIALVSDAGTPGISDPGFRVVKLARENDIDVLTIPGPSAVIAALSISGLPTDSFTFLGFPPRKPGKKKNFFQSAEGASQTLIFYESPFRVLDTIKVMESVFGERIVFVGRELTKKFEESFYGKLPEAIQWLESKSAIKGEFVIVVEGKN